MAIGQMLVSGHDENKYCRSTGHFQNNILEFK